MRHKRKIILLAVVATLLSTSIMAKTSPTKECDGKLIPQDGGCSNLDKGQCRHHVEHKDIPTVADEYYPCVWRKWPGSKAHSCRALKEKCVGGNIGTCSSPGRDTVCIDG